MIERNKKSEAILTQNQFKNTLDNRIPNEFIELKNNSSAHNLFNDK